MPVLDTDIARSLDKCPAGLRQALRRP